MADLILLKAIKKEVLAAVIEESATLDGLSVGLFGNDVVPDEDTVVADLTPPAFSGYAVVAAAVWNNPILSTEDNSWRLRADAVEFRSTTGSPYVGGTAYGYYLFRDATPDVAVAVCRFDEPFIFDQPDRLLTIVPELPGEQVIVG
jgi:hypothetical protein